MPGTTTLSSELESIVVRYHHLLAEHRRCGPEGSARRRRFESRLEALGERFERNLREWVPDEQTRALWRAHLREGAPAPKRSPARGQGVVFRGRSSQGTDVEVCERADGDYEVRVGGTSVERIFAGDDFASETAGLTLHVAGQAFSEVFATPSSAIAALRAFVERPSGEPPWAHAGPLLADGLIDHEFSLTARGRRALGTRP